MISDLSIYLSIPFFTVFIDKKRGSHGYLVSKSLLLLAVGHICFFIVSITNAMPHLTVLVVKLIKTVSLSVFVIAFILQLTVLVVLLRKTVFLSVFVVFLLSN